MTEQQECPSTGIPVPGTSSLSNVPEAAPPAEKPEDRPYLRMLAGDGSDWAGCLTFENAHLVADRIARVLGGWYSYAHDWLSPDGAIELRTSLRIRHGHVKITQNDGDVIVSWSDESGQHQLYSNIRDRAEENGLEYRQKRSQSVWLHFYGEQFTIDSFAISGNRCRYTFRAEYREPGEE